MMLVGVAQALSRVAAYARVSVENELTIHSFEAQVSYYTQLVDSNPGWQYVGIYADRGISGTQAQKRPEFTRMINDCKAGKIDIILVKSVSRFARNTLELLRTVRYLKQLGVSVRFEEEKIDSMTQEGELFLTLAASTAQAESESISENTKWAVRKAFENGIGNTHHRTFGYKWIDGKLTIIPEEAEAVQRIFKNFLAGCSHTKTAKELTRDGFTTINKKPFSVSAVRFILKNITYTGNTLLQKTFVRDPISKKKVKNMGQLPKYLVRNDHEAIIDMETFQKVQEKFLLSKKQRQNDRTQSKKMQQEELWNNELQKNETQKKGMQQMPIVTKIPATKPQNWSSQTSEDSSKRKRRAAAYARVSTDHKEQQNSYEAQIQYYREYIKNQPDLEFVKVFADEGITGTSTKKREGFNEMIQAALDGKIDLIITKSVSRFARNTVDSLSAIRLLKEHGVEVYFEKENIRTLDSKGELLITIMSSLAQEESRSISENTRWGIQRSFQKGKEYVPFKHFLGYDRGENGGLVINQEQAKIVRFIYERFLNGGTYNGIARELTEKGILTPYGNAKWLGPTIRNILTNEKYKGDARLQKKYTSDFLTKKMLINHGEVPQYYVSGCHEAIIEPQMFDKVQAEIQRRKNKKETPKKE